MAKTEAAARPDVVGERGAGYDDDFHLWTRHQAELIRSGQLGRVDRENVAEEIESLGKRERRALESRLEVLIMHLLKWQHQPEQRSGGWRGTIRTQRHRIRRLIKDSPSLRAEIAAEAAEAYPIAVIGAAAETGLDEARFASRCPYAADQLLDDNFWPEPGYSR